ncbi:MAG TPA: hypothetical protein VFV07_09185 [Rhizomicrobium sp.]|nr:hypothetical protein [Rhizomicrobium sp.]
MTGAPGRPRSIAGGIALLVLGLVILVPSGLCTGIFAGSALFNAIFAGRGSGDVANIFFMALIFGGPFVAAGGALVWQGIKRLRREDR